MKKQLTNSIDYMDLEKGKDISWKFFLKMSTSTEVSKEIYPDLLKKYERARRVGKKISFSMPYVNQLAKKWKHFFDYSTSIEERKIGRDKKMKDYSLNLYQLSLRPFFEYLKINNLELSPAEQNFFNFIFESNDLRYFLFKEYKSISFVKAIPTFFVAYGYIPHLEHEANKLKINLLGKKEIENVQLGNIILTKRILIEYMVSCRKLYHFKELDKKMLKILKLSYSN